jgi:hypothetical protein
MIAPVIILTTFILLSSPDFRDHNNVNMSSRELLSKCLSLYDPGKVHLISVFPQRSNEEILEINNETGFYRSTLLRPDGNIVRGMNGSECFSRIGDKTDLTDEHIQENGLDCHSISIAKEHHTCHFGFILNAEKAGLALDNSLVTEIFNGWNCYVLSFTGNPEEVVNDYYVGKRKLYVDKKNLEIRGLYFKHPDFPARTCIYTGKIEVNKILLPQIASVYNAENNSLYFVDVFNPIN